MTRPTTTPARAASITIERRGPGWELTTPIVSEASPAKVDEAIQNLETLHLWKQLDPGTSYYDQYDLTEDNALHIVAWRGADKVVDLFCGKGSSDGQLVRLPGPGRDVRPRQLGLPRATGVSIHAHAARLARDVDLQLCPRGCRRNRDQQPDRRPHLYED